MARRRGRLTKAESAVLGTMLAALLQLAVWVAAALFSAIVTLGRWALETLSERVSSDGARKLRGRTRVATVLSALLVLVAVAAAEQYRSHGPWYLEYFRGTGALTLGLLLFVAGPVAALWRLLGAWKHAGALRSYAPTVVSALGAILASVAVLHDRPTQQSAQVALQRGSLAEARAIAEALSDDEPGSTQLRDALHIQALLSEQEPTRMRQLLAQPWYSNETRAQALESLSLQLQAQGDEALTGRQNAKLEQLSALAGSLQLRVAPRLRAQVLQAFAQAYTGSADEACPEPRLLEAQREGTAPELLAQTRASILTKILAKYSALAHVLSSSTEVSQRLATLQAMKRLGPCALHLGASALSPTLTELDQQLARAAPIHQSPPARQHAEALGTVSSPAARGRPRERPQARGSSNVRCNDGTISPTCSCSRESFRGCCSHHGGVDGCD